MVRYELAKETEKYIRKLTEEINSTLINAKIKTNFIIREPFKFEGKNYFNGFIGVYINFNKKEPNFFNNEDSNLWYSRMDQLAKNKFSIEKRSSGDPYWTAINFEEPSEEELYALTENKKNSFQKGFDRIKRYIDAHNSSIKNYKEVISQHSEKIKKYLEGLENLVF